MRYAHTIKGLRLKPQTLNYQISGVRYAHTIKGGEDARGHSRRGVLLLRIQATPALLEIF